MTIKYKPHKDFDNITVASYSKWDDNIFLMAIPKDEANMDYQQYLEDFKSHGMSILIIDDILVLINFRKICPVYNADWVRV